MHPLSLTRAYRNRPKNPQKTILEKPQKLQDTVKRRPVGVIPLGGDRYREKPSSYSILKPNSPPKRGQFSRHDRTPAWSWPDGFSQLVTPPIHVSFAHFLFLFFLSFPCLKFFFSFPLSVGTCVSVFLTHYTSVECARFHAFLICRVLPFRCSSFFSSNLLYALHFLSCGQFVSEGLGGLSCTLCSWSVILFSDVRRSYILVVFQLVLGPYWLFFYFSFEQLLAQPIKFHLFICLHCTDVALCHYLISFHCLTAPFLEFVPNFELTSS